jgi:hypothetical protein
LGATNLIKIASRKNKKKFIITGLHEGLPSSRRSLMSSGKKHEIFIIFLFYASFPGSGFGSATPHLIYMILCKHNFEDECIILDQRLWVEWD